MLCTRCLRAIARPLRTYSTSAASPKLSTPAATPPNVPQPRSVCREGTVLNGLNYTKGGSDPVALPDDAYPEWLWGCLDVLKKGDAAADVDAGDEFSKSKTQRKLAAKRQKALLAKGDLDLTPKLPLQQQSVNLPGDPNASAADNIDAASGREALRRSMRKERRAKIKESNYLKSM